MHKKHEFNFSFFLLVELLFQVCFFLNYAKHKGKVHGGECLRSKVPVMWHRHRSSLWLTWQLHCQLLQWHRTNLLLYIIIILKDVVVRINKESAPRFLDARESLSAHNHYGVCIVIVCRRVVNWGAGRSICWRDMRIQWDFAHMMLPFG